jgi:hypothetical protein
MWSGPLVRSSYRAQERAESKGWLRLAGLLTHISRLPDFIGLIVADGEPEMAKCLNFVKVLRV